MVAVPSPHFFFGLDHTAEASGDFISPKQVNPPPSTFPFMLNGMCSLLSPSLSSSCPCCFPHCPGVREAPELFLLGEMGRGTRQGAGYYSLTMLLLFLAQPVSIQSFPAPRAARKSAVVGRGWVKRRRRDMSLSMKGKEEGIFTCFTDLKKSPEAWFACTTGRGWRSL